MYSGNGSMCPCINAEISSRNEIFDSASKFGGIGINPYGSETGIFPGIMICFEKWFVCACACCVRYYYLVTLSHL